MASPEVRRWPEEMSKRVFSFRRSAAAATGVVSCQALFSGTTGLAPPITAKRSVSDAHVDAEKLRRLTPKLVGLSYFFCLCRCC